MRDGIWSNESRSTDYRVDQTYQSAQIQKYNRGKRALNSKIIIHFNKRAAVHVGWSDYHNKYFIILGKNINWLFTNWSAQNLLGPTLMTVTSTRQSRSCSKTKTERIIPRNSTNAAAQRVR